MTLAPRIGLRPGGLARVGFGAGLRATFGGLVHFDTPASAFIGCFI